MYFSICVLILEYSVPDTFHRKTLGALPRENQVTEIKEILPITTVLEREKQLASSPPSHPDESVTHIQSINA